MLAALNDSALAKASRSFSKRGLYSGTKFSGRSGSFNAAQHRRRPNPSPGELGVKVGVLSSGSPRRYGNPSGPSLYHLLEVIGKKRRWRGLTRRSTSFLASKGESLSCVSVTRHGVKISSALRLTARVGTRMIS